MNDLQKIDHLTKRCADLLAEMKRLERESIKNKKRGDQLQKDKDNSRSELNKTTSLKEKLEKLCRELQKENNKLKVWVRTCVGVALRVLTLLFCLEREQDVIGYAGSKSELMGREVFRSASSNGRLSGRKGQSAQASSGHGNG